MRRIGLSARAYRQMYGQRPRREGHRPRGVEPAAAAADLALRQAIRTWLREHYPDTPPPYGGGWLYAPSGFRCPDCSTRLLVVSVPGIYVPGLAYCGSCPQVLVARS